MSQTEPDSTKDAPKPDDDASDLRDAARKHDPSLDDDIEVPEPSLAWMDKTLQWGTRARPDGHGLRIGNLNVGVYGEVPDHWDDQTRMPRGAYPQAGVPPIGYSLRNKYELWADNAADLYEEAIQRRWAPASDVPWDTIEPLPDDVEAAMCQLCTELSQQANVEFEAIGAWQQHMSYGYHEVKLFLASEMFDAARHHEAFRKRALSNGGGLGVESRGDVNRMILESKGGWSETCLFLHLMRGTFTLTLYRYGEAFAHNPAEKTMFARCIEDKARHLSYGLAHLRYAIVHQQDKSLVFQRLLGIGERVFEKEMNDSVLREALAIIFGRGIEGIRAGMLTYERLMADYVRQYLAYTDWLGLPRSDRLPDGLSKYLVVPAR